LDFKKIQGLFGTDCYKIYLRQEAFNKVLKGIITQTGIALLSQVNSLPQMALALLNG